MVAEAHEHEPQHHQPALAHAAADGADDQAAHQVADPDGGIDGGVVRRVGTGSPFTTSWRYRRPSAPCVAPMASCATTLMSVFWNSGGLSRRTLQPSRSSWKKARMALLTRGRDGAHHRRDDQASR